MSNEPIRTKRLQLIPRTRDEVIAEVDAMDDAARAHLSPVWLALLHATEATDPWTHGFFMVLGATGDPIGRCGFKGPPDADGVVEIAYGVDPEHQGNGYATEAARGLIEFAFANTAVRVVRAHTLPEANASTRVLAKCGLRRLGEVVDPEDGLVWRWEKDAEEGD